VSDPTQIQDAFVRIGGAGAGKATISLIVNSSDVVPYDPPSRSAWSLSPTFKGYPAFVVSPKVKTFQGFGMGSYSFFNQGLPIAATTAFEVPQTPGVQMHDLLTVFLNGSGSIDSVVNGTGAAVTAAVSGKPSQVVTCP
jgi:hypothetical protein